MNFNKRLQQIIRECDISHYKIARDLGISQTTIKNYEEGKTKPNTLILEQICDYLDIKYTWLVSGDGEKKRGNNSSKNKRSSGLRYYDIEASAGPGEMFGQENNVEFRNVDIPGFNDCDIAINIWGNSMEPLLNNGQIIICKKWNQNFIHYGHIYLIITKDNHRMIKYLKESGTTGIVICESENKSYGPVEIALKRIIKLYIVKGYVERFSI